MSYQHATFLFCFQFFHSARSRLYPSTSHCALAKLPLRLYLFIARIDTCIICTPNIVCDLSVPSWPTFASSPSPSFPWSNFLLYALFHPFYRYDTHTYIRILKYVTFSFHCRATFTYLRLFCPYLAVTRRVEESFVDVVDSFIDSTSLLVLRISLALSDPPAADLQQPSIYLTVVIPKNFSSSSCAGLVTLAKCLEKGERSATFLGYGTLNYPLSNNLTGDTLKMFAISKFVANFHAGGWKINTIFESNPAWTNFETRNFSDFISVTAFNSRRIGQQLPR